MKQQFFTLIIGVFLMSTSFVVAQHDTHKENLSEENSEVKEHDSHSEKHNKNAISFLVSHTFISNGKVDGDRKWIASPSFGINYNHKLSEHWGIGLHNDLIIEEFVVEDPREGKSDLERSYPFSTMLAGFYKLNHHWAFLVAAGAEFEENETFGLIRIGVDYGIPIVSRNWELVFAVNYDILIEGYDSFNFGIGIAKLF